MITIFKSNFAVFIYNKIKNCNAIQADTIHNSVSQHMNRAQKSPARVLRSRYNIANISIFPFDKATLIISAHRYS